MSFFYIPYIGVQSAAVFLTVGFLDYGLFIAFLHLHLLLEQFAYPLMAIHQGRILLIRLIGLWREDGNIYRIQNSIDADPGRIATGIIYRLLI